ncbi:MAG: NINE protein [Nitrospirae bacterium]|nr:NINE protein [Nitrospirota bacterium]
MTTDPRFANRNDQENRRRSKGPDEKFCESCGEAIKANAAACPVCGAGQKDKLNKTALLLLTFFLGGFGAHKFYTRRNLEGFFYLIFCWTMIPRLISLVEFVIYAFTSSEDLQKKYSATGNGVVIAIAAAGIVLILLIGIIAAIAIPAFLTNRNAARQRSIRTELMTLKTAEEIYFADNNRYSINIRELNFIPSSSDVNIEVVSADENCFFARGAHNKSEKFLLIDCHGSEQYSD